MIKAVICDLDGVIVTTDEFHYQAWKRLFSDLSVHFDKAMNDKLRGISRMDSLNLILDENKIVVSEEEKINLAEKKNSYYKELLSTLTPQNLMPGVLETLHILKDKKMRLAIASSSKNAPFILSQLGITDLFEAIIDGNCITHSKPNPEVFQKAADALGMSPCECIVIEDAKAGIDAAKSANMTAVEMGENANYDKADIHIRHFSEILDILENSTT